MTTKPRYVLVSFIAVFVLFVSIITPCLWAADEPVGASAATIATVSDYLIQEDDVLRIDVWGESQLSNVQLAVTPGGTINVPYIGEIRVIGLTQSQVADRISSKLSEKQILMDAKVVVGLIRIHDNIVKVLGQVNRPGASVFKDGDTVLDAIAMAGSYTENAWLEKATLNRKGVEKPIDIDLRKMLIKGDMSQNVKLVRGDVINIPAEDYNNKFYVLGQVNRPGIFSLKENTTVLAALSLAGGPLPRGAVRSTTVIRISGSKPERIPCNLVSLFDNADISQDIVLKAGDVVMVPETKKPDWNKLSQIINTVFAVSSIRRYGLF